MTLFEENVAEGFLIIGASVSLDGFFQFSLAQYLFVDEELEECLIVSLVDSGEQAGQSSLLIADYVGEYFQTGFGEEVGEYLRGSDDYAMAVSGPGKGQQLR